MVSKVVRANNSDRRVRRDSLILYKVVSSFGTVQIRPSNIYGPLAGIVVLQLARGVRWKSSVSKMVFKDS